jgi:hypothetical protein
MPVAVLALRLRLTIDDQPITVEVVTTQDVQHLARFTRQARELRVALVQFPDFEAVYLFDLAQDGYGYAVNIQVPSFSEWGTAPVELWQGRKVLSSDWAIDAC